MKNLPSTPLPSPLPNHLPKRLGGRPQLLRRAVTLMELLITMAILALLAAAIIGASGAAMEGSRRARTKSTIAKLHALLMDRWESYPTRRVVVNKQGLDPQDKASAADRRMLGLRELARMEIPDRWADVLGDSVARIPPQQNSGDPRQGPKILAARPAISDIYFRRYQALTSTDEGVILQNQGAECLYMTIMLNSGDGEAASLFREQDIGDTDNDGAPEFLDGWGRPIQFIRWPTGFVSPLQDVVVDSNGNAQRNPIDDHDPFDVFRRDMPSSNSGHNITAFLRDEYGAFRTTPLIYSLGPDGASDINAKAGFVVANLSDWTDLDPYHPNRLIGESWAQGYDGNEDGVDNSADNIHNHLID